MVVAGVVVGVVVVDTIATFTITDAVAQAPAGLQTEYRKVSVPDAPALYLILGEPVAITTALPNDGWVTSARVEESKSPESLPSTSM